LAAAHDASLAVGATALVGTGLVIEIPAGYEGQIRPRSGLSRNHGITVLNTPGTIDSDFRGQVMVILINHGPDPYTIRRGERIAQLVIAPVHRMHVVEVSAVSATARGEGGFGSTGRD